MEINQLPPSDEPKKNGADIEEPKKMKINENETRKDKLELPIIIQEGSFAHTNFLMPQMADISLLSKKPQKSPSAISIGVLMKDCVRKVDFVLVYEKEKERERIGEKTKNQKIRDYFHENLKRQGLHLEFEDLEDTNKILTFVKIHAPWPVMCRMAERLKFNMPLWVHDAPMAKKQSWFVNFFKILWDCKCNKRSDRRQEMITDRMLITLAFSEQNVDRHAVIDKDKFFLNKQRIEIVWEVLQSTRTNEHDDKKCGVERLLEKGVYETAFPLHDGRYDSVEAQRQHEAPNAVKYTSRQKLTHRWATWSAFYRPQPLERIRNYFGEKIGFYFAFMDFYIKTLLFPSLMGLVAFFYGIFDTSADDEIANVCSHHKAPGIWYYCPVCKPPDCEPWLLSHEGCSKYRWDYRLDNEATMTLSYCTMLWAIIFLKFWKRRESTLATEWDTIHIQDDDSTIRPEFARRAPTQWKNPVTLETEPHMPFYWRGIRMSISILITVLILCLDGVCLIVLLFCRVALYGAFRRQEGFLSVKSVEYARWTVHGLLFLMILFFERIYNFLAYKLTLLECPRTHHSFTNSLLWKLFIFQMLNEFVPIWYAAFLKGKTIQTPLDLNLITEICDGSCTQEVTELVAILLLLRLGVQNIVELAVPFIKNLLTRFRAHNKQDRSHQSQWLRDYHLNDVELDGVYEDYMEMMIQFAFIMLFIPSFPLAPLICLINNILEIRIDSIKILRTRRRPVPIRVAGISTWNRFLEIIVKLSVICNAAFISFTSDIIGRLYFKHVVSHKNSLDGYAKWSMTSIDVEGWGELASEMLANNVTKCYYGEMRDSKPPYDLKPEFWSLLVIRLVHFIVYIILFYGIMWLINICVDDIPNDVALAVKRRKHVIMKSLEAEGAIGKSQWAQKTKGEYHEALRKYSSLSNISNATHASSVDPLSTQNTRLDEDEPNLSNLLAKL